MSGLIRGLPAFFAYLAGRRAAQQEQAAADAAVTGRVLEGERRAAGDAPLTLGELAGKGDRGEL